MNSYNLIKGIVYVDKQTIKTDNHSLFEILKWRFLTLVSALYIYDRVSSKINESLSTTAITLNLVYYGLLTLFIAFMIYHYWIKSNWTNKLNIENLRKVLIVKEEENPLNVSLILKNKFNTLNLEFRETEDDYKEFLTYLRKNNSKFIIKDERI